MFRPAIEQRKSRGKSYLSIASAVAKLARLQICSQVMGRDRLAALALFVLLQLAILPSGVAALPELETIEIGSWTALVPTGWKAEMANDLVLVSRTPGDPQTPAILLRSRPAAKNESAASVARASLKVARASVDGRATTRFETTLGAGGYLLVTDLTGGRSAAAVAVCVRIDSKSGRTTAALVIAPPREFEQLHGIALAVRATDGFGPVAERKRSVRELGAPLRASDSAPLVDLFAFCRGRELSAADRRFLEAAAAAGLEGQAVAGQELVRALLEESELQIRMAEREGYAAQLRPLLAEYWWAAVQRDPRGPLVAAIAELIPVVSVRPAAAVASSPPSFSTSPSLPSVIADGAHTVVAVRWRGESASKPLTELWSLVGKNLPDWAELYEQRFDRLGIGEDEFHGVVLSMTPDGSVVALLADVAPGATSNLSSQETAAEGAAVRQFAAGVLFGDRATVHAVRPENDLVFADEDPLLTLAARSLDAGTARTFPTLATYLSSLRWQLDSADGDATTVSFVFEFADRRRARAGQALLQLLTMNGLYSPEESVRRVWRSASWSQQPLGVALHVPLDKEQTRGLLESLVAQSGGQAAAGAVESALAAWALQQWVLKNVILFGNPAGYRPF